jgi:hypothetical protein
MSICSEGWKFDSVTGEIRVVGGGEIAARFVSPKPFVVDSLPKGQQPSRDALKSGKGLRTDH